MVVSYQDKKKGNESLDFSDSEAPCFGNDVLHPGRGDVEKRGHILDDWRNHPHWGFLVQAAYVRMVNRP